MKENDKCIVRPATPEDLESIVQMHMRCFPEYYLTHLGTAIVRETYRQYFRSELLLPLLALVDGKPVGFIAGSYPGGSVDVDFWQNNFGRVVLSMLRGVVCCDKVILGGLWHRIKRIIPAVVKRFRPKQQKQQKGTSADNGKVAWLVSIAVLPESRGCGVANALMDYFTKDELQHGAMSIYLCAYKTNARACAFYEKAGFSRIGEGPLLYTFRKQIADQ